MRQRAAEEMKDTARAAAKLGVDTVVGFTGSSIWHTVAMFPPVPDSMIEAGYADFADRWNPILDVFDEVGVRFAHEVHPSEIAYDYWTTVRTLEAIGHRPAFGLNWDPSPLRLAGPRPGRTSSSTSRDRIYHVDCKDAKVRTGDGRRGRLSSHLPWADLRRGWDFVSTGHGDVPWEDCFRALNAIGYNGPISIEWEDAGMDRLSGRPRGPGIHPSPQQDGTAHRLLRRGVLFLIAVPLAVGPWGPSLLRALRAIAASLRLALRLAARSGFSQARTLPSDAIAGVEVGAGLRRRLRSSCPGASVRAPPSALRAEGGAWPSRGGRGSR